MPSNISARLSVGLCPGPWLSELMDVSTQSAPASMAFMRTDRGDACGGVHMHVDAHVLPASIFNSPDDLERGREQRRSFGQAQR